MPDARTIPHVAAAGALRRGPHVAVVEGERRIGYDALADAMMRCAAAFVRAGLAPGDRVAIWAHNGIDWIIACLGAQTAGAAVVPINTRFRGGEAHYVLARSKARFLVHDTLFLGTDFVAMLDGLDLPDLDLKIAMPTAEKATDAWERFLASGASDPQAMAEAQRRLDTLSPDAVSDILFTSGTTGAPKGVVTTHGQNVLVYREWARAVTLDASDRYLLIWPFFHCSGYKSGWLASLIAGSTLYPEPTLDTDRLIARIAEEQISVLPGPPTLFQALLASPEGKAGKLASLRVTVTGATMVAPSLIEDMRDVLGLKAIFAGYGLTESCGTATMTDADDGPEVVVTSPGKAIRGTEIAAVDPDGRQLPAGTEGEIVIRGYNVMQGYLDDPDATAEAIDVDGWLRTGDIGTVSREGYLAITGRSKDIYIVGGFNCYPAEIEDIMRRHPAIGEVAVVGMPDPRLGEVGKAFVILRDDAEPVDEAAMIGWCRNAMANYKVPRSVRFVADLPRTTTGKVQKFRLATGEFG